MAIDKGAPIAAPGVPFGGVVWCTTALLHLLVWIGAAVMSSYTMQHADDLGVFKELSTLGFASVIITIVAVAIGAIGSLSNSVGFQLAGTFVGQLFATVALFAHVGTVLDAKDQRYLARDILQNAAAVDTTVLSSADYYQVQAAMIATIAGYMILMYFGKITADNASKTVGYGEIG